MPNVKVIDPAAWGIYTDGTHAAETTNGLQAAIQDAQTSGYLEAVVPPGTYLIRSVQGGVFLPGHIAVTLSGGTVMKVEPNDYYGVSAAIFTIREVSGVRINGGTLIGDRSLHTYTPNPPNRATHEYSSLIHLVSADDVIIENMHMSDSTGDCILAESTQSMQYGIYNPCRNLTIRNCTLEAARRNNISLTSNQVAVVEGCRILQAGITKDGVAGTTPKAGIDVEGHRDTGWAQYKGLYDASTGVYPSGAADKYFWQIDVPGTINGVFYGKYDMMIYIQGAWRKYEHAFDEGSAYADFVRAENVKIVGCTFLGNQGADLNLYDSHYAVVDGNRFDSGVAMGFGYHVTVSNNIFKQASSQKTRRAIEGSFTEVAKAQFVTGNLISGYDVGLYMGPYLTASGNMIHDCNKGIQGYNVRYAAVTGNKIERCPRGVVLHTLPDKSIADFLIDANVFDDVGTGIITTEAYSIQGLLIQNNTFHKCRVLAALGNGEITFAHNRYDASGITNQTAVLTVASNRSPVRLNLLRNLFGVQYASPASAFHFSGNLTAYIEGNLFHSGSPCSFDMQTITASSQVRLYNNHFTGTGLLLHPNVDSQSNLVL